MALLHEFDDDEHLPDAGIVMVADAWPADGRPPAELPDVPVLEQFETRAGCGTIGRAGHGWAEAAAPCDGYSRVRLEAHDCAPADDLAAWEEVVETPLGCRTGGLGLSSFDAGPSEEQLRLARPGLHRLRVSRRRAQDESEGDVVRLQVWPAPDGHAVLPQWRLRTLPAVAPAGSGWDVVLPYDVRELGWELAHAVSDLAEAVPDRARTGITLDQFRDWGVDRGRPADWLRRPLDEDVSGPDDLAVVAGLLEVDLPVDRSAGLDLLTAAGILTVETGTERRWRPAVAVPRVTELLPRLPDELAEQVRAHEDAEAYSALASDVASVACWSGGTVTTTVRELAERLLVSEDEVGAVLRYAVGDGLLAVDDDAVDGSVVVTALPVDLSDDHARDDGLTDEEFWQDDEDVEWVDEQAPPDEHLWPDDAIESVGALESRFELESVAVLESVDPLELDGDVASGWAYTTVQVGGPRRQVRPPFGAPARAGLVLPAGALLLPRGAQVRVPGTGSFLYRALETAAGVLVVDVGRALLVQEDGSVRELMRELDPRLALAPDGCSMAVTQSHYGRTSWQRLHLVDLVTGSVQTMPWHDPRDLEVVALHEGAVHVRAHSESGSRWARSWPLLWRPGQPPETVEEDLVQVDPHSGARLLRDVGDSLVVVWPDGQRRHLPAAGQDARLAPHARVAVDVHDDGSCRLRVWDLVGTNDPVTHLVAGPSVSMRWEAACWEDADHLLVPLSRWDPDLEAALLRLDVATGRLERVPGPSEDADGGPAPVAPLLAPQA